MIRVITGDCRDVLATMPAESVHCCVTSPPYFGLRDYGIAGQIGLEPTMEEYVSGMVEVFREVRRVLRSDGTLWLNLGDSYAANGRPGQSNLAYLGERYRGGGHKRDEVVKPVKSVPDGLKSKDLCGIPWRVAFALQADGWYLRQDIIWAKPNPMPESVTDRCTKSHEYMFLLTKSARYYWDAEAVKEESVIGEGALRNITPRNKGQDSSRKDGDRFGVINDGTRNKRSVWTVATEPFEGAHFAVMPTALIEPCILAGTSAKGCCAECGAPWVRQVEKPDFSEQPRRKTSKDAHLRNGDRTSAGQAWQEWRNTHPDKQLGWSPFCACDAAVVPATILDPFAGAGTTGLVADRLQRNAVLIELNPTYVVMAEYRIRDDAPLFFVGAVTGAAAAVPCLG